MHKVAVLLRQARTYAKLWAPRPMPDRAPTEKVAYYIPRDDVVEMPSGYFDVAELKRLLVIIEERRPAEHWDKDKTDEH